MAAILRAHESEIAFNAIVSSRGLIQELPQFNFNHWRTATAFGYACGINCNDMEEKDFHKKVLLVLLELIAVSIMQPIPTMATIQSCPASVSCLASAGVCFMLPCPRLALRKNNVHNQSMIPSMLTAEATTGINNRLKAMD